MAQDEGKQDEGKFEFTREGEALGYISLDQARVLAIRTAREAPGNYGRQYRNVTMAFELVEESETEDHYLVTLSFRPQGRFTGTPGQEQFIIEKEGNVAVRQVLAVPSRRPRLPVIPTAVGFVIVGGIVAVAAVFAVGGFDGGGDDAGVIAPAALIPVPPPTSTPAIAPQVVLTTTPAPTPRPLPTPTPIIKEVPVEVTKEVLDAPEPTARETIVFADLNWDTAQIQNAIARRIVEDGFGYLTEAVFGETEPLWQGLVTGDIDVTMEIWLPNLRELWEPAVATGKVIQLGKSLDDTWQSAFVVPTYVVEQNPGLKTVQDLRDYIDIFPQERGQAVLVNCLAVWRCSGINDSQVKAYGLDDIITLQDPGSADGLFASLEGAYAKGEPWLGYLWGPSLPSVELDVTRLEEPQCPAGIEPESGCRYPVTQIRIAVHPTLVPRAPEVIEFLRNWNFTAAIDVAANAYKAETDASFGELAIWFLKNHEVAWTQWVPADVAQKVKKALVQESLGGERKE